MIDIIPERLQKDDFCFVLLKYRDKIPFEKEWTINPYKHNDQKLLKHIEENGNYGVACGYGNLIVLDFDNKEIQDLICSKLPDTFTVKSGSGMLHKYFIIDKPESFKILDDNKNTLIDIQGKGKQVVAPGSTHPNGTIYTVIDDTEISNITLVELKAIFGSYLPKQIKKPIRGEKEDVITEEIKRKVNIRQILNEYGIDTSHNPTNCPLHSSKKGKCLSFGEELWHCFHCDKGGDVFNLVIEVEKFDFIKAKRKLMNLIGMEDKEIFSKAINIFSDFLDMSRQFIKLQPVFYDNNKIWWMWNYNRTCWDIVDETDILNKIDTSLNTNLNTIRSDTKQNILEALRRVGRLNIPKPAKKTWVQLKDKVIDIENGEIFDATSEYLIVNPIPWEIGETDDTPTIEKIFKDWVGVEYIESLYEIIAYCMLPDYPIHRIFVMTGSGSNGKSSFLGLLKTFVGDKNICSTELETLITSRFETSKVYKKLVCIMGETNFSTLKKTSIIKRLTGQDTVGFEFKNKMPFDDYNYSKIIIATNTLPMTYDKTIGFYRRWLIIDFPNYFSEDVNILSLIPKIEYNNLAKKSINLLQVIYKERKFNFEGSVEERRKKYEEKSDPIALFLKEKYIKSQDSYTLFSDFYEELSSFLGEKGYRSLTYKEVSQRLMDSGFNKKVININRGGTKTTAWGFIGLKKKSIIDSPSVLMEFEKSKEKPIIPIITKSIIDIIDKTTTPESGNEKEKHIIPIISDETKNSETSEPLETSSTGPAGGEFLNTSSTGPVNGDIIGIIGIIDDRISCIRTALSRNSYNTYNNDNTFDTQNDFEKKQLEKQGIFEEFSAVEEGSEEVVSVKERIKNIIIDLCEKTQIVTIDNVFSTNKLILNIDEEIIERYIELLKKEGEIYEPKPGFIGVLL